MKVNIGQHFLEIRPLISRAKRIIISNACPIIPNGAILDELAKVNITPCSQITYIRAGINDPGFSHVLSFRRQMYINPEDFPRLSPSFSINTDGTDYFIYLSAEKMTCFLCNEEGHTAKHCKNIDSPNIKQIVTENSTPQVNNSQQNSIGIEELSYNQVNLPNHKALKFTIWIL